MEGRGKSCTHHKVMTCRSKRGTATSSCTSAPAPPRPQGPPQHLPTSSLLTATPLAPHRVSGSPEHDVKSFYIKNGTESPLPPRGEMRLGKAVSGEEGTRHLGVQGHLQSQDLCSFNWSIFSSCEPSLAEGMGSGCKSLPDVGAFPLVTVALPHPPQCSPNHPKCHTWCDERRPISWTVTGEINEIMSK